MRLFWNLFLRSAGWKVRGSFPYHLKKCIVILGPHTSSWDFVIGLAFRSHLRLYDAHFLGKEELFRPPFGFFFRRLGGVPVKRSESQNMVQQATALFELNEHFLLVLAPEGTRKKVDRLRTGFYHIARAAQVPIVMAGLDFSKKELIISAPMLPSADEAADFKGFYRFYAEIRGKRPAQGMMHLAPENEPG